MAGVYGVLLLFISWVLATAFRLQTAHLGSRDADIARYEGHYVPLHW